MKAWISFLLSPQPPAQCIKLMETTICSAIYLGLQGHKTNNGTWLGGLTSVGKKPRLKQFSAFSSRNTCHWWRMISYDFLIYSVSWKICWQSWDTGPGMYRVWQPWWEWRELRCLHWALLTATFRRTHSDEKGIEIKSLSVNTASSEVFKIENALGFAFKIFRNKMTV